ncbi:MAG: hypothetical protein JWQ78_731 [Sediminibacterium sp.]|jgi:hypothetical protein|nr:hypothetical protein [Sediminibacterium sp.]
MKKLCLFTTVAALLLGTTIVKAQDEDKSKRPSPPAKTTATLAGGARITIDYSQPSLKNRTIGKDVEPMKGQVWRAGANEATVFETDKPVSIEGKTLPAGKYAFFTIDNGTDWTLIFNKTAAQWGAYDYKQADDALRVNVKPVAAGTSSEKLTYTIDKSGLVALNWGKVQVPFRVK